MASGILLTMWMVELTDSTTVSHAAWMRATLSDFVPLDLNRILNIQLGKRILMKFWKNLIGVNLHVGLPKPNIRLVPTLREQA